MCCRNLEQEKSLWAGELRKGFVKGWRWKDEQDFKRKIEVRRAVQVDSAVQVRHRDEKTCEYLGNDD